MIFIDYEDEKFRKRLGNAIKRLRVKVLHMSEEEAAKAFGRTASTIKKIEAGERSRVAHDYCESVYSRSRMLTFGGGTARNYFPNYLYFYVYGDAQTERGRRGQMHGQK